MKDMIEEDRKTMQVIRKALARGEDVKVKSDRDGNIKVLTGKMKTTTIE